MNDTSIQGAGIPCETPQPIVDSERIITIDILRGIAILGILITNITAFGFPSDQARMYAELFGSPLDRGVVWLSMFFIEGKFYSLFSFLFGLGVAVQIERARKREQPFKPLYVRRLVVLLMIGLLHDIFIWNGMILINYALLGFLLLPFRKCQVRTLIRWAVGLILLPVLTATVYLTLSASPATPSSATPSEIEVEADDPEPARREAFEKEINLFAEGTYLDQVFFRVRSLPKTGIAMLVLGPYVLAMFLLGMVSWRVGLLRAPDDHLSLLRRIWWWGAALGIAGNGAFLTIRATVDSLPEPPLLILALLGHQIGNPALCCAYIAGIVLLARHRRFRTVLSRLVPVGRIALSNYLLQSLIGTMIFYSFGLAVFGRIGPAASMLIVVAIWSLQIVFSSWWGARFRFGPAEWLWRSLTYRRRQPMLRNDSPTTVDVGGPSS